MTIKKTTTSSFTMLSCINGTVILGGEGELIVSFSGDVRQGTGTIADAQYIINKMSWGDYGFVNEFNLQKAGQSVDDRMKEICDRICEIVCDKKHELITPNDMHTVVPCSRDEFLQAQQWWHENLSPEAIERNKIREIELARAGAGYE